uniref:Pre-mRNA splicing Prp18-interacting factor n=1 Tax=Tanacetum cinerariifolium TaxID=118510 RepID=A0A699HH90_TANCI|nr:hypothetical protein [Tanacetum cinerariifolium]
MASFDYRLNPLYPIKECSSCEALYTTDYCCAEGSLRDRIICELNKTPDLSQRPPQNCPKCGNPVDGHYCQGCALLRKKFKEDQFTYCIENGIFQDFQDTFETFYDNTNVVNALQEPFVVKQDPGENSSQSPPHINHHCCYGCGDSLEDIFCHQCTYELCGKGARYGYNKSNLVDDSPNISNPPLQPPTYSYEFYGNDSYYGHDFRLHVPFTYDPEPCYNQDFNLLQNFQIFQQQYPCCTRCGGPHETCQCDQLFSVIHQPIREKTCAELLAEEHEVLSLAWKTILEIELAFEDKHCQPEDIINDDDDEDCTIVITPILSTEEPDNSLSMGDEHLDTILATESDELIKSSVENLVPIPSESKGIPGNMCDVPFHDNSPPLDVSKDQFKDFSDSNDDSTSIDDDSFSIDDIERLTPLIILYPETFCFDLEEISSGSTTTRSDISLPNYEVFYDIHVKEISNGSTTTHSDSSLYDSFIFDLSINLFPPAGGSDFYEFTDELAHIISPSEYDCFSFKNEPNLGDFTMDVVDDTFPTREPRVHVHNVLPTHFNLQLNMDFILSSESLFTYVVWIFLPFLLYSVAPQYLLSFGNKDTIFDPDISSCHISSFIPDVSHRSGAFIKINVYPKHLNGSSMEILFSTCSFMDQ